MGAPQTAEGLRPVHKILWALFLATFTRHLNRLFLASMAAILFPGKGGVGARLGHSPASTVVDAQVRGNPGIGPSPDASAFPDQSEGEIRRCHHRSFVQGHVTAELLLNAIG